MTVIKYPFDPDRVQIRCARMVAIFNFSLFLVMTSLFTPHLMADTVRLGVDGWHLETTARMGIRLAFNASPDEILFEQPEPLQVEIVDRNGNAKWYRAAYAESKSVDSGVSCKGTVTDPAGSVFAFTDSYRVRPELHAVQVNRTVEVVNAEPNDVAFSSRFSIYTPNPLVASASDFFVPGVWYRQNEHAPPVALARHLEDRHILIREDRMGVPLLMLRSRQNGVTLSLQRLGGTPSTVMGDDGLDRLVSENLQYGALGVENEGHLEPLFQFPGTEGERTYVFGPKNEAGRWALRSHPVRKGFRQEYTLLIRLSNTRDYPVALRDTWRNAYAAIAPMPANTDLRAAYRAEIDLISSLCRPYNGVMSIPFLVGVPTGEVHDTSCQMGFVGAALPAAALILRQGFKSGTPGATLNAQRLIDLWVEQSPERKGVLRTWYDITPDGKIAWRNYPMFLRVACDGVEGVLKAWQVMRAQRADRPKWLAFCTQFGDWLIAHQLPDGSWHRSYPLDVTAGPKTGDVSTDTTIQPVPFLADLYRVTKDIRYRNCAIKAGEFCFQHVHGDYAYLGGTPDNPNTSDKEASVLSLEGFLALYDISNEQRYLVAAEQAAWNAETWVYLRDVPIPPGDPKAIFPRGRTTVGVSLIALGHSGSDNYMARAPFLWYRLYLLTGESHFLDFARLMLYNGRQMFDIRGDLGYAQRGLLIEAFTLGPLRGHGVSDWLPWLGVTILEPIAQLEDVFGSMDIDAIQKLPEADRKLKNRLYAHP